MQETYICNIDEGKDVFVTFHGSKAEAVRYCDDHWCHLTATEKNRFFRNAETWSHCVQLISPTDVDEDGSVINWDVTDTVYDAVSRGFEDEVLRHVDIEGVAEDYVRRRIWEMDVRNKSPGKVALLIERELEEKLGRN